MHSRAMCGQPYEAQTPVIPVPTGANAEPALNQRSARTESTGMRRTENEPGDYIPHRLLPCDVVRLKQHAHLKSTVTVIGTSVLEGPSRIIALHRRKIMDAKPPRIPTPDQVFSPDPEPVAVEFLGDELPAHVRAFLDEQRKAHEQK
jgi:hypothetical protein